MPNVQVEKQYPPADLVTGCPTPAKPLAPVTWFQLGVWAGRTQDALVRCDAKQACIQKWIAEGQKKGVPLEVEKRCNLEVEAAKKH